MMMPSSDRRIDHLDLLDAEFGDLLDHRLGERLKCTRDDEALVVVHCVLDQNLVLQIIQASQPP
jgi:hypothetical protein